MSLQPNRSYPYMHWFVTTGFIAPLLLWLSAYFLGDTAIQSLDAIAMVIAFGMLFSIPVLFLYVLTHRYCIRYFSQEVLAKICFNAFVTIGLCITLILLGVSIFSVFPAVYAVSIFISSLFFKIAES